MIIDLSCYELSSRLKIDLDQVSFDGDDFFIKENNANTLLSQNGIKKKEILKNAEDRAQNLLNTFICSKNDDVQRFLHKDAISYHKRDKSRTYLFLSDNSEVVAYFAIALKPVYLKAVEDKSTNRNRYKLGFEHTADEGYDLCASFLIGQIGRDDRIEKEIIRLEDFLEYANAIFKKVQDSIGGRSILIEVDNVPDLIKRYESVGFRLIQSEFDLTQLMMLV